MKKNEKIFQYMLCIALIALSITLIMIMIK